jgi:hypothetical protein
MLFRGQAIRKITIRVVSCVQKVTTNPSVLSTKNNAIYGQLMYYYLKSGSRFLPSNED